MSYSVVESSMADTAQMAALWATNLRGYDAAAARAKIRLGYADNPTAGSVLLALAVPGQQAPQGSLGLLSRSFYLGERRVQAVTAADFVVNAEHRSLGPAMQLLREGVRVAASRFDFCYGLPNARAAPVFVATRFRKLGAFQRFAKPLRSRRFLSRRLPGLLGRGLAPAIDVVLLLCDRLREARLPERLQCVDIDWNDPALDDLWARRPPGMLLSERTAPMLEWRFGREGRGDWRLVAFRDRAGALRGYAVWRLLEDVFEVGDLFGEDPSTAARMLALTRHALRIGEASSISFECLAPAAVRTGLRQAGLVPREQQFVFVAPGDSLPALPDEAWYLTNFDEDTG